MEISRTNQIADCTEFFVTDIVNKLYN